MMEVLVVVLVNGPEHLYLHRRHAGKYRKVSTLS